MKPSISSVLVTGSEGFIGQQLVRELDSQGVVVEKVDVKTGIDLTSWEQVEKLSKVDLVYHLAGVMFVPLSFEKPRSMYDVNIQGTLNILEYCRLNEIKNLVFASSYLYGPPERLPVDENHRLNPTNPYSRSKLICEELCRGYHEDYGLKCVILRPFNIYGPGQSEKFLIPSIINQLKEQNKIVLRDPAPKRDFLYVTDIVNAYLKAGEFEASDFEIFNIGSGTSYSVKEITEKIVTLSNKRALVEYQGEPRENEIMDTRADICKARDVLNWEPKIDIIDGLKRTYEFF